MTKVINVFRQCAWLMRTHAHGNLRDQFAVVLPDPYNIDDPMIEEALTAGFKKPVNSKAIEMRLRDDIASDDDVIVAVRTMFENDFIDVTDAVRDFLVANDAIVGNDGLDEYEVLVPNSYYKIMTMTVNEGRRLHKLAGQSRKVLAETAGATDDQIAAGYEAMYLLYEIDDDKATEKNKRGFSRAHYHLGMTCALLLPKNRDRISDAWVVKLSRHYRRQMPQELRARIAGEIFQPIAA